MRYFSSYNARASAGEIAVEHLGALAAVDGASSSRQPWAAAAFSLASLHWQTFFAGTLAAAPQVYGLIVSNLIGRGVYAYWRSAGAATKLGIDNFNIAADGPFAAIARATRSARPNTHIRRGDTWRSGRRPF